MPSTYGRGLIRWGRARDTWISLLPGRVSNRGTGQSTRNRSAPSSRTLPAGYRAIIGSVGAGGYVPIEVLPSHLSKAVGIRAVCEHVGIPLSRSVAIGDSNNDVEAVSAAGIGVSIGSGCEALVEVADIVAPSVNADGLAWGLATALVGADPRGEAQSGARG